MANRGMFVSPTVSRSTRRSRWRRQRILLFTVRTLMSVGLVIWRWGWRSQPTAGAVIVTSGTAVANLYPALIEAG